METVLYRTIEDCYTAVCIKEAGPYSHANCVSSLREVCLHSIGPQAYSEIGLAGQYEEAILDEPLSLVITKRERITVSANQGNGCIIMIIRTKPETDEVEVRGT